MSASRESSSFTCWTATITSWCTNRRLRQWRNVPLRGSISTFKRNKHSKGDPMELFRTFWRFALASAVLIAASFAGPALAQQHGKIRLAYASVAPGSDSTFLFAGQQLGFFKEQGIDLEIQISGGAVAATGFVASGAA